MTEGEALMLQNLQQEGTDPLAILAMLRAYLRRDRGQAGVGHRRDICCRQVSARLLSVPVRGHVRA